MHGGNTEILEAVPRSEKTNGAWTVLLLAGDRSGGDPLANHFGVESKPLVQVAERPMIAHTLQTLLSHPSIREVWVMAQQPRMLMDHPAVAGFEASGRILRYVSNSSISGSINAVLADPRLSWPVLVTTADHVLLSAAMIDSFLAAAAHGDVVVGLVDQRVMSDEGLADARTWLPFRDVQATGANLFALRSERVVPALEFWKRLEGHRKRPWRMAWEIGPLLLLRFLLRQLTLKQAFAAISRRLGVEAIPVLLPFARAGVDVDKLADHQMVERLLASKS